MTSRYHYTPRYQVELVHILAESERASVPQHLHTVSGTHITSTISHWTVVVSANPQ